MILNFVYQQGCLKMTFGIYFSIVIKICKWFMLYVSNNSQHITLISLEHVSS